MGNKEHRWRLHGSTFWNAHLISNSKRLGIFLGANQVSALYLDQNLLPLNSHVNRNLEIFFGVDGVYQKCYIIIGGEPYAGKESPNQCSP